MLILDQFGIIQNLQTFPIPQTSFLVGTFLPFLTTQATQQFFEKQTTYSKMLPNSRKTFWILSFGIGSQKK